MSATQLLIDSLEAIQSDLLVAEFISQTALVEHVAIGCERVALWANQLRMVDSGNVANPFLAEMQRSTHDVAALLANAFYVPAASAMRSVCETALYYTYFRTHPAELTTLVGNPDYYISKSEILDFHKQHIALYRKAAKEFGIPGDLNKWYSSVSAVIHGQIPGAWGKRIALSETKHERTTLIAAVDVFTEGVSLIDRIMLLTAGADLWGRFHHAAKKHILKGMSAERRQLLELDGK